MSNNILAPVAQSTITMAANATALNVALPKGGGNVLGIVNAGPQIAFVDVFTANTSMSQIPTANSGGGTPVLANTSALLNIPDGAGFVSAISSGNSTMYFTRATIR